ncbi:MAG: hypothetical protein ACK51N_06575 [bacterium]|jgi:hypothetical protein
MSHWPIKTWGIVLGCGCLALGGAVTWALLRGGHRLPDFERYIQRGQAEEAERCRIAETRQLRPDEVSEREIFTRMSDGVLSLADVQALVEQAKASVSVTEEEWKAYDPTKWKSREHAEYVLTTMLRTSIWSALAGAAANGVELESGAREAVIETLIEAIRSGSGPHQRLSAFGSLNAMRALREGSVLDRAVAALAADKDPLSVEFLAAWLNTEKLVNEQRGASSSQR